MAKKYVAPKRGKEPWEDEICDTCKHSKWFTIWWNISIYDHKPITMHCPYRGKGIFGGTKACKEHCKKPGKLPREEMTFNRNEITYER